MGSLYGGESMIELNRCAVVPAVAAEIPVESEEDGL
jgi:hypothetical protein